ncbi:16S rRNA (uracil(1498)-N(3))-methyltransferase [Desulfobacula sp.]|uniref:16S rRNA (uracil(1498)-N(3))-methyltransferase n=1 Tax=Desulfobacula sp. TaxID=2593537 RepID=UPI0026198959|nr:16S rRNA (uracil(1498)-N(3))-methyltransferase [Desulfobacula sp.]
MNLVLLENKDFIGNERVVIQGRQFQHLISVNKVKKNDRLVCGLLNDKIGTGLITNVWKDSLEMEVHLTKDPPGPLPLTLVLALPRPKMLKRIIENVTSLGVKKIYLINSWRVEKSFWQSPLLKKEYLRKQMILGLEQSRDTVLPKIYQKRFFTQFANEELPQISKNSLCITAHPKSSKICPSGVNKKITLAIGPEGGFIDIEVATLKKQGFFSCHIGQRILRVETAVTCLISRLYS